jgi:hypothetical protein
MALEERCSLPFETVEIGLCILTSKWWVAVPPPLDFLASLLNPSKISSYFVLAS